MKFFEVFEGLSVEKRLKSLFEDTSVKDILSSESLARMDVYIESGRFIKTDDRRSMEKELFDQFFEPENKNVVLHIKYVDSDVSGFKNIWDKYGIYIGDECSRESGLLETIYRNIKTSLAVL